MSDEQPPEFDPESGLPSVPEPEHEPSVPVGERLRVWADTIGAKLVAAMQSPKAAALTQRLNRMTQAQGASFYGTFLTIMLCAWFLSDATKLMVAKLIKEPPAARSTRVAAPRRGHMLSDYQVIFDRDLFNREGKIPGQATGAAHPGDCTSPARSSLPFDLVGTVILSDDLRSLATIEDKTAQMVYPVRVDDEIPGKARILKVEARRVVFTNTATGSCEFIELPEEPDAQAPKITVNSSRPAVPGGIEAVSATQYNIDRKEVDKALSNLNEVLTQARAVPNFENGQPAGYKLFQIVPGSIYAKLGLRDGDVINGVNGEPINDPGKAFALLQGLKDGNHMELGIKRDGKQSTFTFDIR